MKNVFWMAVISILILNACTKKDDLPEDNGCIERLYLPAAAHSILPSDVATVNSLFSDNQIATSNFRYFKYKTDTFQTLYSPFTRYYEQVVRVDQYANGLRLFVHDLSYIFWDHNFHNRGGQITKGTSLDTSHRLTLPQLRGLFLASIQEFDHIAGQFKDSCFKAEFGYYDLNIGTSNAPEQLVKAWRITPRNTVYPSEYPMAYYQDNGKLIVYDNGIRTFGPSK